MPTKNDAKLEVRLPSHVKAIIDDAAALAGQSFSDFVVSTLHLKATQLLDNQQARLLSEQDAQKFLFILDSEEGLNPTLRQAAARYKEQRLQDGDGHSNRPPPQ